MDIDGRLVRIDYGERIYYDDVLGIAGTTYPIGTAGMPSSVIANVITICAARHLRTIQVHGAVALGAAMNHYNFVGFAHEDITDLVNLNTQDVDGSHVSNVTVTGEQGANGFLTIKDGMAYLLTLFAGRMHNTSFFAGACSFRDASYIDLVDCNSISGVTTITVQAPTRASIKDWRGNLILTLQDGGLCFVRGFKGTLEIDEMTGGILNIYANGADITINADCTGGTINIYGDARVADNHGVGCTVNDYGSTGYKELAATGATTGGAYIDALDIDARLYNELTIKVNNTDGANSLDYRVLLRPEYGVADQMIQPEDITLAPADYDFVNIDHKWGQIIVQVRDTVPASNADFSVYAICNKQ